jgi:hypothetical protein
VLTQLIPLKLMLRLADLALTPVQRARRGGTQPDSACKRLAEGTFTFRLTTYLAVCKNESMRNPHAVALGKLGGKARARKTTPTQRREWARMGGVTRAERHSKTELSKWAKLGGRPRKTESQKRREQ